MLTLIEQQLALMNDDEIALWVTHDTILAALVARILPAYFDMNDWPGYLGFLLAQKDPAKNILLTYQPNSEYIS